MIVKISFNPSEVVKCDPKTGELYIRISPKVANPYPTASVRGVKGSTTVEDFEAGNVLKQKMLYVNSLGTVSVKKIPT